MTDIHSPARERDSGLGIIRKLAPFLWPSDKRWVRRRVVLAMVALLLSKVVAVGTPFLYKAAVDVLAGEDVDPVWALSIGAVGITVAYGMARLLTIGFQQLRDVLFAAVGQRALRQIALETFNHVHALSLRYHITRKTGGPQPDHRARRKGRRVPAEVPPVLHRAACRGAGNDRRRPGGRV